MNRPSKGVVGLVGICFCFCAWFVFAEEENYNVLSAARNGVDFQKILNHIDFNFDKNAINKWASRLKIKTYPHEDKVKGILRKSFENNANKTGIIEEIIRIKTTFRIPEDLKIIKTCSDWMDFETKLPRITTGDADSWWGNCWDSCVVPLYGIQYELFRSYHEDYLPDKTQWNAYFRALHNLEGSTESTGDKILQTAMSRNANYKTHKGDAPASFMGFGRGQRNQQAEQKNLNFVNVLTTVLLVASMLVLCVYTVK